MAAVVVDDLLNSGALINLG